MKKWLSSTLVVLGLLIAVGATVQAQMNIGWTSTQRPHATDPDYSVFAIHRSDLSNSAKMSIERSTAEKYKSDRFAKVILAFDEYSRELEKKHKNWSEAIVSWSVDDGERATTTGKWNSGNIRLIVSASEFDVWRTGSILHLQIESAVGNLEASFGMDGLETAFAQVELRAPAVEGGSQILISEIDGVTNPVLIESSKVTPYYPKPARNNRASGQVILQALIELDGTVGGLLVIRCSNPGLGFEKAAKDAVRQWRYEPATKDGRPVEVYFTVVIDFSMR